MRRNVKFPALMAAKPPKHKNPKISVCAFDTIVDIAEVASSEFPVALVVAHATTKTEYRLSDGKVYRSCNVDIDRFIQRHQSQFIDCRQGNYVTGHIVRGMYRDVQNVSDYANDRFWPKSALHLLKNGMNDEWQDVKDIITQSPLLDLRGPFMEKVKQIDYKYMWFLNEDPDERMARYERMTHDAFSAFKVMDGKVWSETPEPCYVAQVLPEGIGHVSIGDIGKYVRNADTSPDTTWWNHLDNKVFSAKDYDELVAGCTNYANKVNRIEILIPEAMTADIASLEIDRCARVLAQEVSKTIAARSKHDTISLPSTSSMAAWTELMAFIEEYNPFDGVPDEVEDRIAEMLDSVERNPDDSDLIAERFRPSITRHLDDWRNRAVDFGFAEARSPSL
jgi:hypothetical protein